MKTIIIFMGVLLAGLTLVSCTKSESAVPEPQVAAAKTELTQEQLVKRGEYIVKTTGCDDCHSPKIFKDGHMDFDYSRRLSGHPADEKLAEISDKSVLKDYALFNNSMTAAIGPWGVSFAANLTPDDTGTGSWSEAQFIKAIREGKFKGLDGGRPLLPPMPWFIYKNMTDDDLRAIFAYLQTLTPVKNLVPQPIPPTDL